MTERKRKLNLGCGVDVRRGWINLDRVSLPGVDVVHDLDEFPYPFPNDHFDVIYASHVLEHVSDLVGTLKELHRILCDGGLLIIRVPHFTNKDAFADPTHKHFFTIHTLRYFVRNHIRSYYFDFSFSKIRKCKIRFDRRPAYFWNYILEPLINLSVRTQNLYEGTPLRIFPAYEIYIEVIK